jgi:hypothetical protein
MNGAAGLLIGTRALNARCVGGKIANRKILSLSSAPVIGACISKNQMQSRNIVKIL